MQMNRMNNINNISAGQQRNIYEQLQLNNNNNNNNNINNKIDILFYDSVKSIKQSSLITCLFHACLGVMFIIFIPIDYTIVQVQKPKSSIILIAMIIAIIVQILQSLSHLIYRVYPIRNNVNLIRMAREMNHHTEQFIVIDNINNIKKLQDCVSQTMYNKSNQTLITDQGLTDKIKQMYKSILTTQIKQAISHQYILLDKYDSFTKSLGFLSIIFSIIALSIGQYNTPQLILLIIFIVFESISKIVVLLVFLIIGLLPLICCLFCFIMCCCNNTQQRQVQLPAAVKATEKIISEADGTCSICYQNFTIDSQVVILKCNKKHVFHQLCIQAWKQVKPNCPICRASLSGGTEAI